jgi:hypothetical protein
MIRIAPIWSTQAELTNAQRRQQETIALVKSQILAPFFFGGLLCYVEKGEMIKIAGRDFFVNECQPRSGVVESTTVIEVEIGFT